MKFLLLFIAAVLLSSLRIQSAEIVLLENGVARLPIIAPEESGPADELAHYLGKIGGSDFERISEAKDLGIYVGTQEDFPAGVTGIDRKLGVEEFVIRSDGRRLFLLGGGEQGVSHAVVTFLHDLGCRWYFPGELWEEVPQLKSIKGTWDLTGRPDFSEGRRIWYGFGAYGKNKADWVNWNRHNRMGGPRNINIGHSWSGLDPDKDFSENPDWFALVDGKRSPGKPCYSHPEVVKRMTAYAVTAAEAGRKSISMSPPDGLGYCECEKCQKVFGGAEPVKTHGSLFATRQDGTVVNITSETLFKAVNTVAAAVAKKHPDVLLACYAYSAYSHPPSFDLHPNIYLQTTTAYRRTMLSLEEQLGQFGDKGTRLGIREYYSVYQWDYDWPNPGKMAPDVLQKDLRFFHENGVGALNAEASNNWAARGLGYYLASRMLWDIDADPKPLIEDFYKGAFGPAAKPMERYFARWYGPSVVVSNDAEIPKQTKLFDKGINVRALGDAFLDLDDAVRATREGSRQRARVDAFRGYLHYLVLRHQLELAAKSGKPQTVINAIREETEFGGRMSDTNMIHTRALLGKAFERRFRNFLPLLEEVDTKAWRKVGTPPESDELDRFWDADRKLLGL